MRTFHIRLAALAVIGTVLLTAPGASASTLEPARSSDEVALKIYQADDPVAEYNSLPPQEQELFVARVADWKFEETSGQAMRRAPTKLEQRSLDVAGSAATQKSGMTALAAGGCWSQYKYRSVSDLGIDTGNMWMTASWCSNGSRITSYSLSGRGGQGLAGWTYVGIGSTSVNNVSWEVRQAQVFKFKFGVVNGNPCIQIRGGATGKYSTQTTCNVG